MRYNLTKREKTLMNNKIIILLGYVVSFLGVLLMILSYFRESLGLFFIGCLLVVIGLIAIITLMSLNLFIKDKELEIEKLRQMGLTIVVCKNCFKENVLEDQYCIYCGESLGSDNDDDLQEEHIT